jgi:transposase-like protein
VYSRNNLQNDLQEYLNSLKKDGLMQEHTIQQINNLRDAITANMVGIISFLHEKYPAIINLENLQTKKHIDNHRTKNEESIARRLEWALYRKFQKKGLVPPNLKQTIFLREDSTNPLNQFGIIHFIPTEKTSSNCPYCKESTPMEKRKNDKFNGEHFYKCHTNKNCGFSTKDNRKNPLEQIDNSDSVASYNISQQKIKFNTKKEKSSRSRPSNRGRK